jgi:hypothetical protein
MVFLTLWPIACIATNEEAHFWSGVTDDVDLNVSKFTLKKLHQTIIGSSPKWWTEAQQV